MRTEERSIRNLEFGIQGVDVAESVGTIMIGIPNNIRTYIREHNGVNVAYNINSVSTNCGYGHHVLFTVILSKITRTCNRCGYDQLWKPDDSESKCGRHTYDNWRYDDVFVWSAKGTTSTLEDAFNEWLKQQPKESEWYKPAVYMCFGEIGFK